MGVDMEMSCDERVLKEMCSETRKDYSLSLLSLATKRRIIGGSPLAFGEGGIKERIKNVLNFKKPSRVVTTVSVALVLVLSIGFAVNRASVNTLPSADDVLSVARTYSLENPTDKQKLERLASITLYKNGTAELATPLISSYLLPACTYSFEENELLIYANIEMPESESAYGVNNGDVIARFAVADDGALVFESATVPLFADAGARYVLAPMTLDDLNALSTLRTPYVGDNSAVGKIIYALPQIDNEHTQQYFSIGDDYGTGRVPFTLTIYYESINAEVNDTRNITVTPENAALLFALIDNLEEVSFAFRNTPSDGELDTSVYISRVSYSKEKVTEYLESIGLTWEDFLNDWVGSIEKMYAVPPVSLDLEAAVSDAILEVNKNSYLLGDLATEAHTTLATVEQGDTVTVYLMALYQVYRYSGGGFYDISGDHIPVAITFDKGLNGGYTMTEYWIPRDGSYYIPSIREKFPPDICEDAIDTQKYICAHIISSYEQAVEYGKVDTNYQIASLIETICSSPVEASNPRAYIKAHSIEFRELVYYGRYTLDYCFSLFEQGSQTGLEGHIMAAACGDIMTVLGEKITEGNFDTGQDWYNAQSASE